MKSFLYCNQKLHFHRETIRASDLVRIKTKPAFTIPNQKSHKTSLLLVPYRPFTPKHTFHELTTVEFLRHHAPNGIRFRSRIF